MGTDSHAEEIMEASMALGTKEDAVIHIAKVYNSRDGTKAYFISEEHPDLRSVNGQTVSMMASLDLSDPEALPGTAPIEMFRALMHLNRATGGAIETLLMRFFDAGLAARRVSE